MLAATHNMQENLLLEARTTTSRSSSTLPRLGGVQRAGLELFADVGVHSSPKGRSCRS